MNFIWNLPLFTIVLSLFSGPLCIMLKAKAAKYYTLFLECSLIFMTTLVFWYTLHTARKDDQLCYTKKPLSAWYFLSPYQLL